jgi:hypothetical protein
MASKLRQRRPTLVTWRRGKLGKEVMLCLERSKREVKSECSVFQIQMGSLEQASKRSPSAARLADLLFLWQLHHLDLVARSRCAYQDSVGNGCAR